MSDQTNPEAQTQGLPTNTVDAPIEEEKSVAEAGEVKQYTEPQTQAPQPEYVQIPKETLSGIMEQIKSLQDQINEQKGDAGNAGNQKYDGPLHFSYKLWWGVPICSILSKKKDPTKSLRYRGINGNMVSNHLLVLALADNSTIEVDVEDFGLNYERSAKMEAQIISSWDNVKYRFSHEVYKEFDVLSSAIN